MKRSVGVCALLVSGGLAWSVLGVAAGCSSTAADESGTAADEGTARTMLIADFEGDDPRRDARSGVWRPVNDNIMGGRSIGGGAIRAGSLVFAGSTNTNGGGFSSVRAGDRAWDLAGFDGLAARVRADGRRYVFHLDTGLNYSNGNVFYRGSFETDAVLNAEVLNAEMPTDASGSARDSAGWQEVYVPFSAFVPMVRGRDVTGRVEPIDPAKIRSVGLMIDDGLDGPFRLEADWIRAQTRSGAD